MKMDLQKVEWVGDWMEFARDRDGWCVVVDKVMNFRVP